MGRAPCCDKANVKKGPWSPEEDTKLKDYIEKHSTGGNWISLPQKAGLKRCGKSCRLRWLNYLRPNIRHGDFTDDEDRIICTLFATIGSRWSVIAAHLPGRTDNDIKNYWNTKLKKKIHPQLSLHKRLLPSFPQQQSSVDDSLTPNYPQHSQLFPVTTSSSRSYEDHHRRHQQQPMFAGSIYYNPTSNNLLSLEIQQDNDHNYYMNSSAQVRRHCSNNFLVYGNEAASSSSDGSCVTNQANDYLNYHLRNLQMSSNNYFGNYVVDNNHGCSSAAAAQGNDNKLFSSSFDYGIEEIKQLISSGVSNYSNNFNVFVGDDIKTEGEEVILDE